MNFQNKTLKFQAIQLHISMFIYAGILFYFPQNNPEWEMSWVIKESNYLILFIMVLLSLSAGSLSVLWPLVFKNKSEATFSPAASQKLFFDFDNMNSAIQTTTILRMGLAESIAIFGFAFSFLNQTPYFFIPFGIVALILQILVGPFRKNVFGF